MSELALRSSGQEAAAPSVASPRGDGLIYLGRAIAHPTGTMFLFLGICLGTWLGGAVGLLAGVLGTLGLVAAAARWDVFRRVLDGHALARERRRRDFERERRLELAGPLRRAEFAELSCLVEEIEDRDPGQAQRLELQELLQYYVELALGHQRLVEAVQRGDRAPMWEAGAVRNGCTLPATSRQRQDILSRRLAHRDECRKRAAMLADELDAIAEFLHLVSEVVTCPLGDLRLHRELERRLWELETQENALRQLNAA
jgi:hypothetical protein